MIKKYTSIIKIAWQEQLTHRMDFLGWRITHIVNILSQVIIWTIIFKSNNYIKGYTYEEMITYIIIGWFFLFLSNNYGIEGRVARHIHRGELSNFITKPLSYLRFITTLSIGRISIAFGTSAIIQLILIFLFRKIIIFNIDPLVLLIISAMLIVAYFVKLFMDLLIGFLAFWTNEIVGLYSGLRAIERILSGAMFPINLLPALFLNISIAFPFVYTFFVPVQLYLGKMSVSEGLKGIGVEIIWLIILYGIIKLVWKWGLKKYESVGI